VCGARAQAAAATRPAHTAPVDLLFSTNLSGAEPSGNDAIRPLLEDWKGYIERYDFKLIRYHF
jgi:hypothetical protein